MGSGRNRPITNKKTKVVSSKNHVNLEEFRVAIEETSELGTLTLTKVNSKFYMSLMIDSVARYTSNGSTLCSALKNLQTAMLV